MGSLIMAYAFDLDKESENEEEEAEGEDGWVEDKDNTMLGMVPMADILNSDAEFNVGTKTLLKSNGYGANMSSRHTWIMLTTS